MRIINVADAYELADKHWEDQEMTDDEHDSVGWVLNDTKCIVIPNKHIKTWIRYLQLSCEEIRNAELRETVYQIIDALKAEKERIDKENAGV